MHRPKMRPILLIAGLIGLVAIVFGLVNTTNNAHATTPVGPWKLVGTVVSNKKAPTGTEWQLTLTAAPGKALLLTKGALVITINSTVPANDYTTPPNTKSWRVLSIKPPSPGPGTPPPAGPYVLRLTQTIPGECVLPPPPAGGPNELYTGPCVKPAGATGNAADLTGVSDIVVDNAAPNFDFFHCIARTDIDAANSAKFAAVCFDNTGSLGNGTASEPIHGAPGEGANPNKKDCSLVPALTNPNCYGPPPPPPYAVAPPAKGTGTYNPGTDTLTSTTCFPDVGKSVNIISVLTNVGAHAQMTANGKMVGTVLVYVNQPNSACDALVPIGPAPAPLGSTTYPATDIPACGADPGGQPAGVCQHVPWRLAGAVKNGYPDWDMDGCTDAQELWQDKPGATTKCGDDPWNKYDVMGTDASGEYDITAIAIRQDCNPAGAAGVNPTVCDLPAAPALSDEVPGFYYDCKADIQQTGKNLTVRLLCYTDSPLIVVNPQAVPAPNAGATSCAAIGPPNPAPAAYCGDGISGAPPPGSTVGTYNGNATGGPRLLFKVGGKQAVLTGIVDNAQNVIKINGCFQSNVSNPPPPPVVGAKASFLGDVWVDAVINLHTGHGQVKLWAQAAAPFGQGAPPCPKPFVGVPLGSPPPGMDTSPATQGGLIPIHIVRQAFGPKNTAVTLTCAAGVVTVTTPAPHQMLVGKKYKVRIQDAVPAGFNYQGNILAVLGPNTFTYPKNPCPAPAGTANWGTERDSDGDGCSDKKELGDSAALGGLRDPFNPYDYFNPTHDKLNRVDDILAVVNQYFINDPPKLPDLNSPTDRTAIAGDSAWNLGPPDGLQTVADILAAVKSYFHDC